MFDLLKKKKKHIKTRKTLFTQGTIAIFRKQNRRKIVKAYPMGCTQFAVLLPGNLLYLLS